MAAPRPPAPDGGPAPPPRPPSRRAGDTHGARPRRGLGGHASAVGQRPPASGAGHRRRPGGGGLADPRGRIRVRHRARDRRMGPAPHRGPPCDAHGARVAPRGRTGGGCAVERPSGPPGGSRAPGGVDPLLLRRALDRVGGPVSAGGLVAGARASSTPRSGGDAPALHSGRRPGFRLRPVPRRAAARRSRPRMGGYAAFPAPAPVVPVGLRARGGVGAAERAPRVHRGRGGGPADGAAAGGLGVPVPGLPAGPHRVTHECLLPAHRRVADPGGGGGGGRRVGGPLGGGPRGAVGRPPDLSRHHGRVRGRGPQLLARRVGVAEPGPGVPPVARSVRPVGDRPGDVRRPRRGAVARPLRGVSPGRVRTAGWSGGAVGAVDPLRPHGAPRPRLLLLRRVLNLSGPGTPRRNGSAWAPAVPGTCSALPSTRTGPRPPWSGGRTISARSSSPGRS